MVRPVWRQAGLRATGVVEDHSSGKQKVFFFFFSGATQSSETIIVLLVPYVLVGSLWHVKSSTYQVTLSW